MRSSAQASLPGLQGEPARRPAPLIVSASRRTDLPGYHAQLLADRVRRVADDQRRSLYGLVLWTRYPAALLRPPLRPLLEGEVENVVVNLTVTGLGGSRLEPNVPATGDAIAAAVELVGLLGEPARLRWRFDPLLHGLSTFELFESLAGPLAAVGVPTVTVSFPATMSLKGPLSPQYAAAGIAPWPGHAAKVGHARELLGRARAHGLRLLACCQPKIVRDVPGVEPAQCIPREVLEQLCQDGIPFPSRRDHTQRKHCQCLPSLDIGDYATDRCGSGCAYCYSRAGGP